MSSQELRNLQEAYLEVIENQQLNEEKKKYPYAKVANQKRRLERTDFKKGDYSLERSNKLHGRHERLRGLPYHKLGDPEHRLQDSEKTKKQKKPNPFGNRLRRSDGQGIRDSYDYYDIILSHLLDEGKVKLDQERRSRIGTQIGNRVRSAASDISASGSGFMPKGIRDKLKKSAAKKVEGVKKMMGALKSAQKEEVDLYDIILSHLLDEGYAETPEAAESIMVNMSEEWRDSIIDCD